MSDYNLVLSAGAINREYWRDIWKFRELMYVLAWRDVAIRYKQTIIGIAWVLLQPLLTMLVFTFIFSKIAKLPTEGATPYALMVYSGILPWQLFSGSLLGASGSLVANANLISKVYFPRMIIPLSSMVVSLIDFLVSLVILLGLMVWYKFVPDWKILTLPLFVAMAIFASIGPGLLIAALNIKYRDFRYVIPFVTQFGLYVSPIGFSSKLVPEKWQIIYALNPMVGVIDGFRWAILTDVGVFPWVSVVVGASVVLALMFEGVRRFRATERGFADLI
jgi:lipopolysaccharide transport system permease protein